MSLDRLAKAVRARMDELELDGPTALVARGGPAPATTRRILAGEGDVWPRSLRKLDRALGWATGSAAAVLDGGEPGPLTVPATVTDLEPYRITFAVEPDVWAKLTPAQQAEARAAGQAEALRRIREMGVA